VSLATRIPRIFRQAWLAYGQPQMAAVQPITGWTLPAGFAYDGDLDVIQNAAGAVITNPEDYWAMDYLDIVPTKRTADLQMLIAAGEVPAGSVDVYILSADAPTVRAAHSIEIDGDWYDVYEVAHGPVGVAPAGNWARVRLTRRS
jgi:hypothetical protein